jgi:cell division septal protein FtsQ
LQYLKQFAEFAVASRIRKHKKFQKNISIFDNRFFWLGMIGVVFAVSFVYVFFFSRVFEIQHIVIEGNRKVDIEKVRETANTHERNIILLDIDSLGRMLLLKFPQIKEVTIQKKPLHGLEISLVERRGSAVWCAAPAEPEASGDVCYAVDAHGVVFEPRDPSEFLPLLLVRNIEPVLGTKIVSEETLGAVLAFDAEIKNIVDAASYDIISESRFNIHTELGWEIYAAPLADIGWQAAKLQTVLEKNISDSQKESLEYIDLRFGDQAVVKYRE